MQTPLLDDALAIYRAALAGLAPDALMARHDVAGLIRRAAPQRIKCAAFGKAAIPMAIAFEAIAGDWPIEGVAVVPHGCVGSWQGAGRILPARHAVLEAGHPIPDAAGVAAAHHVIELARSCKAGDLFVALISGGGSALLPAFADGISLEDARSVFGMLLRSGAAIGDVNAVRKHLSAIGGGRLAKLAAPAEVLSLIISDVPGDGLAVIASGPTVPDPSTFADAGTILERHEIWHCLPAGIRERIERGLTDPTLETPKPGDEVFGRCRSVLLGGNGTALDAAGACATALGYMVSRASQPIHGEARDAGALLGAAAMSLPSHGKRCILAGGESTVVVRGAGKGGRNQEFALGAARAMAGSPRPCLIMACGTDGIDGPTDAAGAWATPQTVARANAAGMDAGAALEANNTYPLFDALGQLVRTGPTHANATDIAIAIVGEMP